MLVDGQLIGPVTLVRNGDKTIGTTDPELLRPLLEYERLAGGRW